MALSVRLCRSINGRYPPAGTVARGNQGVRLSLAQPQVTEPSARPVDRPGPAAALGDPDVVEDQDPLGGGTPEPAPRWVTSGVVRNLSKT
ncbi:hypothetical protein OHB53_03400 [Streptomyces sp. NBC_00056]|uniref:hypothetical protein n=1 Tax=unclassified Streptomyces TaxID=2593676 RepID=UPI00224F803A|nr:hypothetical protein [Streptomyces sp. NBC_00063]MCX5442339.1 hypothetical protein [Streptomyces sp. NBC_00063]